MRKEWIVVPLLAFGVVSCGGGGGSESNNSTQVGISGRVVDEPIEGLIVKNTINNATSTTDNNGKFALAGQINDTLDFYIGNLKIGQVKAIANEMVLTPVEINPTKWQVATALIRQLDIDNNSSNGIQLPQNVSFGEDDINQIDFGTPLEVKIDNKTITLTLNATEVPEYLPDLSKVAEAYSLLKRYEGSNIKTTSVNENVEGYNITIETSQFTYQVNNFYYNSTNPLNSYAELSLNIELKITNEADGTITCSSQEGKLYYDSAQSKIIGTAPLQCKGSVTVDGKNYPVSGPLNGEIIIDPNNIDWQQVSINGADVSVEGTLEVSTEEGVVNLPIDIYETNIILAPEK